MIRSRRAILSATQPSGSPVRATSSNIGFTYAGAPPWSGPESAPTAAESAAPQSAPVDATIRAVNVDAFRPCSAVQIQYVSIAFTWSGSASPRQRSRNLSAAVSPLATTSSGAGSRPSAFAAERATISIISADRRPRSSRACSSEISLSLPSFQWPESRAVSVCRSEGAFPVVGGGFRSVNVTLRKTLDLYGQVRPCKSYPGVRSRYEHVDLIIVREATEDLYAGIEYEEGSAHADELAAWIEARGGHVPPGAGISIKPLSVEGSRRIVQFAFDYARRNGRRKVTAVHKANIMKFSDGLFLRVAREVAEENGDVEFEDRIVDNLCMQLVQRPEEYDVLVLPNLYGDIVSDLAAGLVGGPGFAPGANFGTEAGVFQPTHGAAPKYAGQNKVNPMAMMLSGVLMLRHLGEREAADRLEGAIADVIAEGASVTYDMKPTRDDPTAAGTSDVADAIIDKMGARV